MTNDTSPPEPELYGRAAEVHREMQSFADKTGVLGDTDYSPMTANEAGRRADDLLNIPAQDGGHIHTALSTCACGEGGMLDADGEMRAIEATPLPSKSCTAGPSSVHDGPCPYHGLPNCTEGGDHCFCTTEGAVFVDAYRCCYCPVEKVAKRQRVPGHGPYRTELVRD